MTAWRASPVPDREGYYALGPTDEVQSDRFVAVKVQGETILLTRLDDRIHALSAYCPHAAADLSQVTPYRGRIDCPDHGYRFDIRTGRVLWPEDELCRLKRFDVRVQAGVVMVRL